LDLFMFDEIFENHFQVAKGLTTCKYCGLIPYCPHNVKQQEALPMVFDIRLPRALEVEGAAGEIRRALAARSLKLWPGGVLEAPVVGMSEPLERALREAQLRGRLRCGFESVREKLAGERKGIEHLRERQSAPQGDRVSRLILFSNDGAERFYRHVESLLQANAPRLLGCLLDIDGRVLGNLLTGGERPIKLMMAEHKEAVSGILLTLVAGPVDPAPAAG
jgi:hypothetical protein